MNNSKAIRMHVKFYGLKYYKVQISYRIIFSKNEFYIIIVSFNFAASNYVQRLQFLLEQWYFKKAIDLVESADITYDIMGHYTVGTTSRNDSID